MCSALNIILCRFSFGYWIVCPSLYGVCYPFCIF